MAELGASAACPAAELTQETPLSHQTELGL